jgi:hypothetical protein
MGHVKALHGLRCHALTDLLVTNTPSCCIRNASPHPAAAAVAAAFLPPDLSWSNVRRGGLSGVGPAWKSSTLLCVAAHMSTSLSQTFAAPSVRSTRLPLPPFPA